MRLRPIAVLPVAREILAKSCPLSAADLPIQPVHPVKGFHHPVPTHPRAVFPEAVENRAVRPGKASQSKSSTLKTKSGKPHEPEMGVIQGIEGSKGDPNGYYLVSFSHWHLDRSTGLRAT